MNYLRDKRMASSRRKKGFNIGIVLVLIIFIIVFFRQPIFNFFSSLFTSLGRPIWTSSNTLENTASSYSYIIQSKKSLLAENQILRDQLMADIGEVADREVLADENAQLKEILGRTGGKNLTLGVILAKPNKSPYDTLIIDIGADAGLPKGIKVFAYGNILIGQIAEVNSNTSLVKLFSTPGEKVDVTLDDKNVYVQAVGRGGQNFEITVPREMNIEKGAEAVLP